MSGLADLGWQQGYGHFFRGKAAKNPEAYRKFFRNDGENKVNCRR
jgi:hypothetical protein